MNNNHAKNINTPPTIDTNINADCAADNELFLLLSINVVKFIFGSSLDELIPTTGVDNNGGINRSFLLLILFKPKIFGSIRRIDANSASYKQTLLSEHFVPSCIRPILIISSRIEPLATLHSNSIPPV
ncbi:hypothetical protein DERP_004035 [Dermatophagoides pteronyssinus]|uniref:Uncharacterized protein n=1 Tax=Dermatophagoides pteronyssinus TaxID=6956 RepID=A0ABQ8J7Y1_DERPT|nr:hypothetical protein DERP_004035 [Dermatophagoides pteronyssinus]